MEFKEKDFKQITEELRVVIEEQRKDLVKANAPPQAFEKLRDYEVLMDKVLAHMVYETRNKEKHDKKDHKKV